jgi:hypothetical protein
MATTAKKQVPTQHKRKVNFSPAWAALAEARLKYCKLAGFSLENPPKSILQAWSAENTILLTGNPDLNDSYLHGRIEKPIQEPSKKARIKALVWEYLQESGFTVAEIKGNYAQLRRGLKFNSEGWPIKPTIDRWGETI